jgi:hypothetical protein
MGRVARLASLWPPSPPFTRRSSTTAAAVTVPKAATPLPPTGRPPAFAVSTGSLERTPMFVPTLLLAGKLMHWGWINTVAPGRVVQIMDESTQRRFLVDKGAAYSIFPLSSSGKQSSPRLKGADGLHIHCWDERRLSSMATFLSGQFCWPGSSSPSSAWTS